MTTNTWEKVITENGEIYWWNPATDESSWNEPDHLHPKKSDLQVENTEMSGLPPPPPPPPSTAQSKNNIQKKVPAPPPPLQAPTSPASKLQNLVKTGSMRLRALSKKEDNKKAENINNTTTGGALNTSNISTESASSPPRRKISIQEAAKNGFQALKTSITQTPPIDPSTLDGHLLLKAREKNMDVKDLIDNVVISKPLSYNKTLTVTFNEKNLRYEGLPEKWVEEAHRQFGIPLQSCPRVEVKGYDDRIPLVLVKLKERFMELDGPRIEGVFRLAPDGKEVADLKYSINTGDALRSLNSTKDPHVVANLIKQFYRELTPKILSIIPQETILDIAAMTNSARVGREIDTYLPEPQKSSFYWLLDLLSQVAKHQDVNRMTATNLAIVISPNLYDAGTKMEPFEELILSQKVASFTTNLLKWRMEAAS